MGKIIKLFYKSREEWWQLRSEVSGENNDEIYRIGASDVAAACGWSSFKSPLRVFYEALGMVTKSEGSFKKAMGLADEPTNKRCYAAYDQDEMTFVNQFEAGVEANKIKNANYIAINGDFPYIFSSLDFQRPAKQPALVSSEMFAAGENIPFSYAVDAKNCDLHHFRLWNNQLPKYHKIQALAQALSMGVEYSEMGVKVGSDSYHIFPVVWDAFLVDLIKERTEEFCKSVISAKPLARLWKEAKMKNDFESMRVCEQYISNLQPDIIGSSDDIDVLEELTDSTVDSTLMGTDLCQLYYDRYRKALRAEAIAKTVKNMAKAYFVNSMGAYKYVKFEEHKGRVTHYKKENGNFYWNVR